MHLRVAGLTFDVRTADPDLPLAVSPATARFVVPPAPPDVQVHVSADHLVDSSPPDLVFDSGGPWRLFREPRGLLFEFRSTALGRAPYKIARVNDSFTDVEVVVNRACYPARTPVAPLEYPLDELLVIHLLGLGRGLELHGCGVVEASGAGYLFVGQSGAGKSTMARLWLKEPGTEILSDDRIVLRAEQDGIRMYGTPWHGEEPLSSPASARLTGIFLLRQHSAHAVRPLSAGDAAARLLAASFPPFHDPHALAFSLEFCLTIPSFAPCQELGFVPDPSVVDFVRVQY